MVLSTRTQTSFSVFRVYLIWYIFLLTLPNWQNIWADIICIILYTIHIMDIYRVQLICQAQSRFAVRSRLYDWVETDKLVLLQSHTFLGFLMPDSRDMVAGIFSTSKKYRHTFSHHLSLNEQKTLHNELLLTILTKLNSPPHLKLTKSLQLFILILIQPKHTCRVCSSRCKKQRTHC